MFSHTYLIFVIIISLPSMCFSVVRTGFYRGPISTWVIAKIRFPHVVFPHKMLIELHLTREVEITDITVKVGVATGALVRHGSTLL